ncbi:MAG: NUDIX hydrolase [Candidatus Sericytochromatia bacterium]|nr:NUDIX hydrolase [Candidatus Sericytochromatia bacterium]
MSARPIRASATVLLLRDGAAGLEVYMVRRVLRSDFMGGAYVFPGGAVDPEDGEPAMCDRLHGRDASSWAIRLNLPADQAGAHVVAAVRETFEEAGILLSRQARADAPPPGETSDARSRTRWQAHRRALLARQTSWREVVVAEDWRFDANALAYFAHWITPVGVPKRFSTRFFVALAPSDQVPLTDDQEVEAGVWITPQAAIAAREAGTMTIVLPTHRALQALSAFDTAEAVLRAYADRPVPTILPRIVAREGQVVSLLPGDPGYEEAADEPLPEFDPSVL